MESNYDKFPAVEVPDGRGRCVVGWEAVCECIRNAAGAVNGPKMVVVIECYTGVFEDEVMEAIARLMPGAACHSSRPCFRSTSEIDALVAPFNGGDDPVFGWLSNLRVADFMDPEKIDALRQAVDRNQAGLVFVVGAGASLVHPGDILVYADLARWEAQMRMRRDEIPNLGADNHSLKWSLQYKRAFFIDWRACDDLKRGLMERWDFVLDTHTPGEPRMTTGELVRCALREAARRPFRVVPFFDPGPWGGQWMRKVCDLDPEPENYAWCFDCVPEENSLLLDFGDTRMELPSIDLVFYQPRELLGESVFARFGAEFPIRFDFLDTMDGGHLSFQVHPLTDFIQRHFGMHYTQDESYYILDSGEGATVYLGLREGIDPEEMIEDLRSAQRGEKAFDDGKFVARFPAKKHDHFLIPAGTCHCSGRNSMVLEISATPYIFTFKLWDWGRVGLDGLPRPINIERGIPNIRWERDEAWARKHLVNRIEPVATGDGWREERTGLHELEFIETRRHWFTGTVPHDTAGTVHVLNLVEGREAIVESPTGAFAPFIVHYAETFIVPAAVGPYTIRPHGAAAGSECATMKAFVRS
jgi:mannose-6-phosphate isomerase class I